MPLRFLLCFGGWLCIACCFVSPCVAQRHLFSPADTMVEIYDATGKKLAENDDGLPLANESLHDFATANSWLAWIAPQPGSYFIRLTNQGDGSGPAAVYRLLVQPLQPDFVLYQWPDAVPIWGPGTTATGIVNVMSHGGWVSHLELQVTGLPSGWKSSTTYVSGRSFPRDDLGPVRQPSN